MVTCDITGRARLLSGSAIHSEVPLSLPAMYPIFLPSGDWIYPNNPDVTLNQYMDFFMNKYVPKFEESFPGLKLYVVKGNRGEHDNNFALFFVYDSEETRDKFWPEDDVWSDFGTECWEKLAPTVQELQKLGTWTSVHTDWVVQ